MIKNILIKEDNTDTKSDKNAKYTIKTVKNKNNIINIISPKIK